MTLPALLPDGTDNEVRALIHDLLALGESIQTLNESFAATVGLSRIQYLAMIVIDRYGRENGISVGDTAAKLRRTTALMTNETTALARNGLVTRTPDPSDGRRVLLRLTAAGYALLTDLAALQRPVNDVLFDPIADHRFPLMRKCVASLVESSERARLLLNELVSGGRAVA